jgi:hypothetical protein
MAILPLAILFNLDDTILVAFGPAESQWQRTIAATRLGGAPIRPTTSRTVPVWPLNAEVKNFCDTH